MLYVTVIILILALTLFSLIYSKKKKIIATNFFMALILAALAYNLFYMFELTAKTEAAAKFWFYAKYNTSPLIHFSWFMLSIEYVGTPKKIVTRVHYLLLVPVAVYLIILNTDHLNHLFFRSLLYYYNGSFNVIVSEKGLGFFFAITVAFVLMIISITLYLNKYISSTRQQKPGLLIMIIVSVLPIIPVLFNLTGSGYLQLDLAPAFSAACSLLYFIGAFNYNMFLTIPIAFDSVFRLSETGMLIVDFYDHIVDANDTFKSIYSDNSLKMTDILTLSSFLKAHQEYGPDFAQQRKTQFSLIHNNDLHYYSAKLSDIVNKGIVIGKILTLDNVTELVHYQLKLQELAEEAEKKAEFHEMLYLQAQIKPHFLNNTLNTISSMITIDSCAAKKLIINFSDFLRNSYFFSNATTNIPLRHELEAIQTYVDIQRARFEERLTYHLDCTVIPNVMIQRFLLQPLVENAIKHGVLKKIDGGTVTLKIALQGNKVYFEIRDDGVGINKQRIENLLDGTIQMQGIGLLNIHKRLKKLYGEGLQITSNEGHGTTIRFCIVAGDNEGLPTHTMLQKSAE